ncbi:MAG: hypothetical protein C0622_04700 [Desulfuromonas sp.]|nr:MAG: hypothetical protein C0622_04700 [Desulfuromonas sp.]
MSVKLIKSSKEDVTFLIEIDAEIFEKAVMDEFLKTKDAEEKPTGLPLSNRAMLGQHPELEKLASQGLNNVLPIYYMSAIKELGVNPITYPEIRPQECKIGDPCRVEIRVGIEPEIELQQYEGLQAVYSPVIVTDEDVKRQIDGMRKQRGAGDDDEKLLQSLPFDTLEAFSAEVRLSLESLAEEKTQSNKRNAVIRKLIQENPCPLRDEVVDQQVMLMINQFRKRVGPNNFDNYLKSTRKTMEQAKKEARPEAVESVTKNLLLGKIVDKISPEVSEEDIKKAVMAQDASIMDVGSSYEARRKRIDEMPGALEQFKHIIRLEKATEYVIAKADLQEGEPIAILDVM